MIDYVVLHSRWILLLLGLLVVLLAHGIYSITGASRARDALELASDSITTLIEARVPLEMREDSLRLIVDAQREALQADSARWARELEEANERTHRAQARASTLLDSIRVRVDSTTLELVDSLVVEHNNETTALESQLGIMQLENVALRDANTSLTELMELRMDLEASLRAEIQQQALGINELERLVNPPFSLRVLSSAKVAVPMVAVGVALGFILGN
jgi:hypothetical protein